MVDKIEILFKNGIFKEKSYIILPIKNVCYINNDCYSISEELITKMLDILATWKYEYGSDNSIDKEEFKVIVYSNSKKTIYHGKGIYPFNYHELLEILGGLQNG